jgi:hypothetical protein
VLHPPVGMEWMTRLKQLRQSFIAKRPEVMKSDKENPNEQ